MRTMAAPLPVFSQPPPPQQSQQPQQPMVGIEAPHDNDVLCGRGVTTNRHVGNENFRSLVNCNKELYVTSTKRQKMTISRSIVDAVRTLDPPGRFLEKDTSSGRWYDIGDKKAVEKTSQALRDGAACLRKQLSEDLSDPDFLSAVFDMDEEVLKETQIKESQKQKANQSKKAQKKATPAKGHRRVKSNPLESATAKLKAEKQAARKQRPIELPVSPRATQKSRHSLHLPQIPRPPQSPMSQPTSPAYSRASSVTLPVSDRTFGGHHLTLSPAAAATDSPRFFRHGRFTFDGPAGGISTSRSFEAPAVPPPIPNDPMSPPSHCGERDRPPPPRPFPSPAYSSEGPMSPKGRSMQHMGESMSSPPPSGPLPPGLHRLSPAGYQQQQLSSPPSVHRASRQSPYSQQSLTPHPYRHPSDPMSSNDYRQHGGGEYRESPASAHRHHAAYGRQYSGGSSGSGSGLTVPKLGGERNYDYNRVPISPVQIGSPRHHSHLRHRPQGPAPRPRPEFMPPPSSASPRSRNRNPERIMSASPRVSGRHHRNMQQPPVPPPPPHHSNEQQPYNRGGGGGDPHFYPRNMSYRNDMPPQPLPPPPPPSEERVEKETLQETTTLFVTPDRVIRSTSTENYHNNGSPSGVVDGVEVVLEDETTKSSSTSKSSSKSPIIQRKSSKEEERDQDNDVNPASDIDDDDAIENDMVVSPLPFESSTFFEDDPEEQNTSLLELPDNIMTLPISPCGPNDVATT